MMEKGGFAQRNEYRAFGLSACKIGKRHTISDGVTWHCCHAKSTARPCNSRVSSFQIDGRISLFCETKCCKY